MRQIDAASPPPRTLYRFVGRVNGVARSIDLVDAARAASDDLRWKAHSLGADVIPLESSKAKRALRRLNGEVLEGGRRARIRSGAWEGK